MRQKFQGWNAVAERLTQAAEAQEKLAEHNDWGSLRLNAGQCASLRALAARLPNNPVVIADEVGMGKTRIAAEVIRCVKESGGRVAIILPPGLSYQWLCELNNGGVEAPAILRSLKGYFHAWQEKEKKPWYDEPVVMLSHAFTNWRIGEKADRYRFTMVPEIYALWQKKQGGRIPRGYGQEAESKESRLAASDIVAAVPSRGIKSVTTKLDELISTVPWGQSIYEGKNYENGKELRKWLEFCIGLGLGTFDLIVIDEAHKSRGVDSNLTRLIDSVVLQADNARKIAITATPVELDISQWHHTLSRIGIDSGVLESIKSAIENYDQAVKHIRTTWRTNVEAKRTFIKAAEQFEAALSPYLIRRDKREDVMVQQFQQASGLSVDAYRKQKEIEVDTASLSFQWKRAICAAEALSVVTEGSNSSIAKRLRLTIGNGHGISALLDQLHQTAVDTESTEKQTAIESSLVEVSTTSLSSKKDQRAQWWSDLLANSFTDRESVLFDHPAILKAVDSIEQAVDAGEKVLVFGRFTRPLRALVDLLNAREMLKRLNNKRTWPQSKVHGAKEGDLENSEWPAVRAAHRHLKCCIDMNEIDRRLEDSYDEQRRHRETVRDRLLDNIRVGLISNPAGSTLTFFEAFEQSVRSDSINADKKDNLLNIVARAITNILGDDIDTAQPADFSEAFRQLLEAISDGDEADTNHDGHIDDREAFKFWSILEQRLQDEYSRPQGTFARLMNGATKPESRRMLQLAFNRKNSNPKVLVAQSAVGREGLNLHKACRIVLILHPEWNPGVIEQQIGRVDRVGSVWSELVSSAIANKVGSDGLPRIEIWPVIFRATYDEHNWAVLRERWSSLRAQLHGVVIPSVLDQSDLEFKGAAREICEAAPNFSPSKDKKL